MPIHLQKEIDRLKKLALSLSARVEDNLRAAVRAVMDRDTLLARRVIDADREIDRTEVDVEEECLKILALHQPVAIDLRYIVAILKINNDLERVGDLAVGIAERAEDLIDGPAFDIPFDLPGLSGKVQSMLSGSLDAMINLDAGLARRIWMSDDDVDQRNREAYTRIKERIQREPERVDGLISLLSVSRNLERVADHAVNIAKDVLYMVEGEIFRHRRTEFGKPAGTGFPADLSAEQSHNPGKEEP